MTELEIMQRAKNYLDQMANGIDPLSGQPIPEGELLHNARISRCLTYVSGVLEQIIAQGGTLPAHTEPSPVGKKPQKQPFELDEASRARFPFSDEPLLISEIVKRINEMIDENRMNKLRIKSFSAWLLQSGLLEEQITENNRPVKRPTEVGSTLGIQTAQRTGKNGPYLAVLYPRSMQKFLIDHLDDVIAVDRAFSAADEEENAKAEYQGQPWTAEQEAMLRRLFAEGVKVSEIAARMGRTRSGIQARLKKIGLVQEHHEAD